MDIYESEAYALFKHCSSSKEITIDVIEKIEKRRKKKQENGYLESGIPGFNLYPKELIILAGRPAIGKTGFALSLIHQLSINQNIPTAYLTAGFMNKNKFGQRLISIGTMVDNVKLETGFLDAVELSAIHNYCENLYDSKVFFMNIPNCSLEILFDFVGKEIKENNIRFLIIDDVELFRELVDSDKEHYNWELEEVMGNMWDFANTFQIPVMCIWPLGKAADNTALDIRSFYQNMLIPEMADTVLLVNREIPMEFTNTPYLNAQLIIAKSENNLEGIIRMKYDSCTASFVFEERNDYTT